MIKMAHGFHLRDAVEELLALKSPDHAVMGMAVRKLEVVLGDLYGHPVNLTASRPTEERNEQVHKLRRDR